MVPPAEARAQSAPAGKTRKEAAELAAQTADFLANVTTASYDDDDAVLATLKRHPLKKRKPGSKWNGRVAGMTLQEYRERKWSVDACYAKVERRGPSWSMRSPLPSSHGKKNNNFQVGDVFRGFNATLPTPPSFTMGIQFIQRPKEETKGPAEYQIKSTMDPTGHPTIPKNMGARFGSEVLEPRDPTGPAPGDYEADAVKHSSTLKSLPSYRMQGREAWKPPTAAPGPGIGEYDYTNATKHGKLTPIQWNMQGKSELTPIQWDKQGRLIPTKEGKIPLGQRQYSTPGPDHYHGPGAGAKTNPNRPFAPSWKFLGEPRGLRA